MIKVEITNLKTNQVGWAARFNTQEEADAWTAQGIANNWWGKPEREVPENELSLHGEDVEQAVDQRAIVDELTGLPITFYTFLAEYTVEQSNVTEQHILEKATEKALANQALGALVIARVAAINEQKLLSGTLSQEQFTALLADANIANIERLLWNGSLVTAKTLLQTVDLSAYYSTEEVSSIISLFP